MSVGVCWYVACVVWRAVPCRAVPWCGVVWWIVLAVLFVSVLSSMHWLLCGVHRRHVTSMTVPKTISVIVHKFHRTVFMSSSVSIDARTISLSKKVTET